MNDSANKVHWSNARVSLFKRKVAADDPKSFRMMRVDGREKYNALIQWQKSGKLPEGFAWSPCVLHDGSIEDILRDVPGSDVHQHQHVFSLDCYYFGNEDMERPAKVYNARERAAWCRHAMNPSTVASLTGYQPWGFILDMAEEPPASSGSFGDKLRKVVARV